MFIFSPTHTSAFQSRISLYLPPILPRLTQSTQCTQIWPWGPPWLKLLPWYSLSCPVQLCLLSHSPANPLLDKAVQPLRLSLQLSLLLLAMLLHHLLLLLIPHKVNLSCMCLRVARDEQWTQTWITNCVNKNCIYWYICISTVNYLLIFHAREE